METNNQLNLFDNFFIENGEEWSQSLELFDAVPKFNYHRITKSKEITFLHKRFLHRSQEYNLELTPALITDPSDPDRGFAAFPNKREELVMHALRYLATQQQAETEPSHIEKKEGERTLERVRVVFTIHQLRKELKRMGHGYNWNELAEALEILGKSAFKLRNESNKCWWGGTMIHNVMGMDDEEGSRCIYFHELASQAILSGATRRIRYDKLMSLKKPLARWFYMRLCHFCTNAEAPSLSKKGIGLRVTYQEIYEQSGLQELARHRDNIRTIREALEELKDSGMLHNGDSSLADAESWIEEKAGGKPAAWKLMPSNETVSDIIYANKHCSRPQDRLPT